MHHVDYQRADTELRTIDLTLAATLCLHGYEPIRMELIDNNGVWVYAVSDSLREVVHDYRADAMRVEPRVYTKALRRTRFALYAFLETEQANSAA